MAELTRKCGYCKNEIPIARESKGNVLFYDKKWYHCECFSEMCEKRLSSKRVSKKWIQAKEDTPNLICSASDMIENAKVRDDIYRHMLSAYEVTMIPSEIFVRLDSIYEGTAKGLAKPVKPEHLLDMWIQKQSWLDKQSRGKCIDGIQRIRYDLAVLCCKYGDYLKWLEAEKVRKEAERIQKELDAKQEIDCSKIQSARRIKKGNDNSSIFNDIFE